VLIRPAMMKNELVEGLKENHLEARITHLPSVLCIRVKVNSTCFEFCLMRRLS